MKLKYSFNILITLTFKSKEIREGSISLGQNYVVSGFVFFRRSDPNSEPNFFRRCDPDLDPVFSQRSDPGPGKFHPEPHPVLLNEKIIQYLQFKIYTNGLIRKL